jgi:hypothetical protein
MIVLEMGVMAWLLQAWLRARVRGFWRMFARAGRDVREVRDESLHH